MADTTLLEWVYEIGLAKRKSTEWQETDYLLLSPGNAEQLRQSIRQGRRDEAKERELVRPQQGKLPL